MRGGNGLDGTRGHEFAEPAIAKAAGCLLNGLGGFAGGSIGACFDCGFDAVLVKGQAELRGKLAAKREIVVGFGSAKTVVEMRDVEHEAEFPAPFFQCAQQSYGVGTTGKTDGEAESGLK